MSLDVVYEGNMYRVFKTAVPGNVNKFQFFVEETTTGLRLSKFSKSGIAIATAKGLDAGSRGFNGWTPAFVARTIC